MELPARHGALSAQLALAAELVGDTSPDLVVLPECALTGYLTEDLDFDLAEFAEPLPVGTARLATLAGRVGADVVGPVVEAFRGRLYNSVVGVSPSGERWLHYRKRHPWYPETWATPGALPFPLVPWRGLRLSIAVCFDLHFLPDEAAEVLTAADLLLFPSAWVDGGETRGPMLRALADAYGVTVVNPNWGRGRPAIRGQGGSMAVWPDGRAEVLRGGGCLEVEVGPRGARSGAHGPAPAQP